MEDSFITLRDLNIFIGSWNVNAKYEDIENLRQWLNVDTFLGDSPHILVIGLQEMIELNATNTIVGSSVAGLSSERASKWQEHIATCLRQGCMDSSSKASSDSYKLVDSQCMVGIWCCVYARKSVLPMLRNIQTKTIPRGAGGMLGNKGAVCIRMDINHTSVCFVCAHLTAHREDTNKRNEDYRNIMSKRAFADPCAWYMQALEGETALPGRLAKVSTDIQNKQESLVDNFPGVLPTDQKSGNRVFTRSAAEHDLVFFFGDLNYRIMEGVPLEEVFELLSRSDGPAMNDKNSSLLCMDQLLIERREGNAFGGFTEGHISFKPTYRYIAGGDTYDRRPESKLRCPAWCDRVLWKLSRPPYYPSPVKDEIEEDKEPGQGADGIQWARRLSSLAAEKDELAGVSEKVRLHIYDRCENCISDHKPVKAVFTVHTKLVDGAAREGVLLGAVDSWRSCPPEDQGSRAVNLRQRYILERNILWNECREISIHLSNSVKTAPMNFKLPIECVPVWLDVLSAPLVTTQTFYLFEIPASSQFHLELRVNYDRAFDYICDKSGRVPPDNVVSSVMADPCSYVELCAIFTLVFRDNDRVLVPITCSFAWDE